MVRKIWMLPVALLAAGMIGVGCDAEEDYTALDQEYATMEEGALAAHAEALEGWNEWNSQLSTVTVADDADEAHRTAYTTAQTSTSTRRSSTRARPRSPSGRPISRLQSRKVVRHIRQSSTRQRPGTPPTTHGLTSTTQSSSATAMHRLQQLPRGASRGGSPCTVRHRPPT